MVVVGLKVQSIAWKERSFGVPSEFYATSEQSLNLQTTPPHRQDLCLSQTLKKWR